MTALRRYVPRSPSQLLKHILERPDLVGAVRELPAPALSRLIDRIGVEDSGDLLALASTEQIASLLDQDLWRADESGFEERFDPARFTLWLEVMGEAGDAFLARRLSELPVDLLTLAVHRLVLVIDMDALRSYYAGARDEAGEIEHALESSAAEEWEEFCLIARDLDAWEEVWNGLLLLDREHHARLRSILEQCCAMSLEYINGQGGLYEVLTSDEMLESDALGARDDRRASEGYVSRSDARAFLALACDEREPLARRDPITLAYFRTLDLDARGRAAGPGSERRELARAGDGAEELMRLVSALELHAEAPRPPARLGSAARPALSVGGEASERPPSAKRGKQGEGITGGADERTRPERRTRRARRLESHDLVTDAREGGGLTLPLVRALDALASVDPVMHAARSQELAYLANVVLSGCEHRARKLRPVEALEAAVAISNLGFELWERANGGQGDVADAQLVAEVSCDRMFRLAWATLQRDVAGVAAELLAKRSAALDASRARRAQKLLSEGKLYDLTRLCAASELDLDEEAFALAIDLAERLPWQTASGAADTASTTSGWIATKVELARVRARLAELSAPAHAASNT